MSPDVTRKSSAKKGPVGRLVRLSIASACAIGAVAIFLTFVRRDAPSLGSSVSSRRIQVVTDASASRSDHPAGIERRLLQSVRFLASDELEGRGIGTRGIELAADYIAREFQDAGLDTHHYAGEPFQRFARSSRLGILGVNLLSLHSPDGEHRLDFRRDFTPLSLSRSGRFSSPMVFVGYGITAPQWDYDDYRGIDVRGKAVVMLRHEPQQKNPRSVFNGQRNSEHAYLHRKVANAAEHGATAVVFCTDYHTLDSRAGNSSWNDQPSVGKHDHLLGFRVGGPSKARTLPVLHVRRHWLDEAVCQVAGSPLVDLERRIDAGLQPQSIELTGWTVCGEVNVGPVSKELKNVIGTLDANGQASGEAILVGAHYDHVGYGSSWGSPAPGTQVVHNGADDNASGTAVLMELARQLANRPKPLGRRLIFVAFTAEESGLVGSQYYVDHPLVPLDQTVAMINLDMVGRLRDHRLEVYGVGTAAEFESLLRPLGQTHGLRLALHGGGYSPSDHVSFLGHGTPVLHFFTGLHDNYHRPSDDYDKLNIRGMRRIVELTRDAIVRLANLPARPRRQHMDTLDELAGLLGDAPTSADPRPISLSIIGRMQEGAGYQVRRIAPRGLAARSGVRPGDWITRIGSRAIVSESDYAEAVKSLDHESRIPVVIRRGSFELEVELLPD